MMEATTKDLRLHTKELISATDRGEHVIITYHGKPRAKLVPFDDNHDSEQPGQHNPAFGMWADRTTQAVEEQVRRIREPRSFD